MELRCPKMMMATSSRQGLLNLEKQMTWCTILIHFVPSWFFMIHLDLSFMQVLLKVLKPCLSFFLQFLFELLRHPKAFFSFCESWITLWQSNKTISRRIHIWFSYLQPLGSCSSFTPHRDLPRHDLRGLSSARGRGPRSPWGPRRPRRPPRLGGPGRWRARHEGEFVDGRYLGSRIVLKVRERLGNR